MSLGVIVFLLVIKYYLEPVILVKKYQFKYPIPSDLLAVSVFEPLSMN